MDERSARGAKRADVKLSARLPGELFYSELKRQIDGASMKQAAPGAWKQFIKALTGKGVKTDEIEWTGINDWLDLQTGKVSKQSIVEYLDANGVQVSEVALGIADKFTVREAGRKETMAFDTEEEALKYVDRMVEADVSAARDSDWSDDDLQDYYQQARDRFIVYEPGEGVGVAEYGKWTLPGGQNYREVLLTLPNKRGSVSPAVERIVSDLSPEILRALPAEAVEAMANSTADRFSVDRREVYEGIMAVRGEEIPSIASEYRSKHWHGAHANIIAHLRLNDRTDATGARVLFVEEVQSDWAQDGRKEGFNKPPMKGEVRLQDGYDPVAADDWESADNAPSRPWAVYWEDGTYSGGFNTREQAEYRLRNFAQQKAGGVPLAPFVTKTDGWLNLALKRAIALAVDEGYDKIAFVTGEQSAERYKLSKAVSQLGWVESDGGGRFMSMSLNNTVPVQLFVDRDGLITRTKFGLDDAAGKSLGDLIGKDLAEKIMTEPSGELEGEGLNIGGEGMKTFYDQIVPNAVKALAKRLGGRQEIVDINAGIDTEVEEIRWFEGWDGTQIVEWGGESREFKTEAEARSFRDGLISKRSAQPGIVITDEMREKLSGGLPLFSKRFAEAADRAGFDTSKVWYHGTTAKVFKSFKPGKGGIDELGTGIYFTGDPDVAGAWAGRPGMGGRIIPAYLRKGDIYDSTDGVDYMALVRRIRERNPVQDFEREAKRIRSSKSVTEWTPEEAQLINRADAELWRSWLLENDEDLAAQMRRGGLNTWLDRAGYIGRINRNSQIKDQVVVFRPENIRAPWSRFNPKKSASADFLASARIDTPEFKDWSEGLPLVLDEGDYQGGPAVFAVYHGTTYGDITTFERTGSKEGFLGQGPYFTTSLQDASENYAGMGPDLRTRIDLEAEKVSDAMMDDPGFAMDVLRRYVDEQEVEVDLNDDTFDDVYREHGGDAAQHWAIATLKGDNDGVVMPVFVKMTNPLDTVNGQLEYQVIEDENGEFLDETGTLVDWILAAREIAGYRGLETEVERYIDSLLSEGDGVPASRVLSAATEYLVGGYDDNGDPVSSGQIVSEIAEQLGYDGIVMDAGEYFGGKRRGPFGLRSKAMAGVTEGTLHMVPFKANQVKSSIGNSGAFSKESDDIRYSARQTETPEFKRWFGASKVVDASGKPLVMYHGTYRDFASFEPSRSDWSKRKPMGIYYFTQSSDAASNYAGGQGSILMPVYLSASNPFDFENKDHLNSLPPSVADAIDWAGGSWSTMEKSRVVGAIKKAGFDAMYVSDETGKSIAVFDPAQIKSAIGNSGTFDPANPDIRYSAWDAPAPSRFDDFVYKTQDKLIDLKRVTQSIQKSVGALADDVNAYLQEELFHGRAAKRTADFGAQELQPLMEQIAANGLTIGDVEEYLHARHAKEANRIIAQRNPDAPDLQDGGSGMSDADADAYMASLSPQLRAKLESVAARVDGIINDTRQLYVTYGLESQETVDGWASMFKHYIPLQREDKDGGGSMSIGQGFSVKGKETKGRTGSKRKVVDILANIAMQRERLIVRGEKNRVAKALVGMVAANPNPGFWQVGPPPAERVYDPKTNTVVERVDPMYRMRDNVVMAKVTNPDGSVREIGVVFNEDNPRAMRLASALKNLDAGSLEGILGASAKITRYFAAINTQYNPIFGVVNLIRDVQGALLNLGGTPLAGQRARIARDTFTALKGIYGDIRAMRRGQQATSDWAQLWEEFQKVGGQTGFRELFRTSSDRGEALQKIVNPDGWMDSPWGKVFTANGALKMPVSQAKRAAEGLFNWLSDYNEALENGVRLAAYKAGLDQGMSKRQAASLAKNLTVNFNRKGQVGMQAGAVYAFFNAAMQGSARLGQLLFTMDGGDLKTVRLSKTGQKIVYGGLLLGAIQALTLAAAGFDDEDPPDFVRERSLIIPIGGKKYLTIPMPLGLHVIPGLGRHMTEFALSGGEKPAERIASIIGMMADAFNPIGNAGLSMQTLAPTALDPLVALTENRDWTGKPIARTSMNEATPGHALHKDTASSWGKVISEAINTLTGGNEYVAGVISPTPDQIDYLIGQVTGGVGRELAKLDQSGRALVSGEELPTFKMPLVGRFIGDAASQASEGTAFYANVAKLNELETEVKGLRGDGRLAEAQQLLAGRPDAYLIAMANAAERQIQRLRREKRALVEKGAPRERVREVEQRITEAMARLNRAVERAEAQRSRS